MELKLIGIEDVMALCGCSRKYATKMLQDKTCPTLPRKKGQPYRIPQAAFIDWLSGKR